MRELSLHILDLVENSVKASASLIRIEVLENTKGSTLTIGIYDNGIGMDEETQKKVLDPFYTTRTTRKVGMGIPLFKMAAEQSGGSFSLSSKPYIGTSVQAIFKTDHVDFIPLGDMDETILTLLRMHPHLDFYYRRKRDDKEFSLDTAELREILCGVPFSEPGVEAWIRGFLNENTKALFGGAFDEND